MRFTSVALLFLLLTLALAAASERTVTLQVENMTCHACPYIVEKTLTGVPGVITAKVSLKTETATVTFDDSQVEITALTTATANAGFPSKPLPWQSE